jgi:Alpha/beta hydrolase domain
MSRRLLLPATTVLLLAVSLTGAAGAASGAGPGEVAAVAVTPATGGNGVPIVFAHTSFDLATVGYAQTEFFLRGTAAAFSPAAPLATDGRWQVAPTSTAPYTTRIVVDRPADPRRFNGTAVVEWLNVSGGVDASPDWIHLHDEIIRRGYAWVGVSAQAIGMNALKAAPLGDPARYASLAHPGDSYSYDIFSQAGQAVRDQAGTVLSGLRPRRVLAVGESQSAGRLVTYIDAVHPLARTYDGFLVHSRSAAGAPLSPPPLAGVSTPAPSLIRADLDVPVLVFQTETDIGGLQARSPDSPRLRIWEAAGTAHFDLYGLEIGATDAGGRQAVADWLASMRTPPTSPPNHSCVLPINTGPQTFVLRSALAHLNRWAAGGRPPPSAPRFETVTGQPTPYALDANGNVRGGIRTPAVDAPVATLGGLGNTGTASCFLFGTTAPLTADQLRARYRDHRGFAAAWTRATLRSLGAGFLRPEDARNLVLAGVRSDVLR